MISEFTQHATERLQQRGVPPLIAGWLLDYGEETFDGHGGVVRYFTRRSIRRLSEYLRCYLVQSNDDGSVITIGKRHPGRRIRRN